MYVFTLFLSSVFIFFAPVLIHAQSAQGAKFAQQVFHTDVLPSILCRGSSYGLHDAFHEKALEVAQRMGKKTPPGGSTSSSGSTPQEEAVGGEEKSKFWFW